VPRPVTPVDAGGSERVAIDERLSRAVPFSVTMEDVSHQARTQRSNALAALMRGEFEQQPFGGVTR
jgi:hypothetical protein